jgi:hypothetical protein
MVYFHAQIRVHWNILLTFGVFSPIFGKLYQEKSGNPDPSSRNPQRLEIPSIKQTGLPDFSWYNIPNKKNICIYSKQNYQTSQNIHTKWQYNVPNVNKIF